jgi:DNA-binding PadR family transcriptional regulator
MPLHHAVLALLADKPAHGYELKASFERSVGEQWGGLNIGHLYQLLDRLARDGLIESERQSQATRPDRVVHSITDAGRAELASWRSSPSARSRGYRDDFFLKVVAAAGTGNPSAVEDVLRQQRMLLVNELRALGDARATHAHPSAVEALLLTAAAAHARADLEVVDEAEQALLEGSLLARPATTASDAAHAAHTADQIEPDALGTSA